MGAVPSNVSSRAARLAVFICKEIAVSIARAEYFKDLVSDCIIAAEQLPHKDQASIIAALIIADSINGLRKAIREQRGYGFTYDKD